MNSESESEFLNDQSAIASGTAAPGKQNYRRNQFGGSFGGPIQKDKVHFFLAVERTQQDTTQVVNTLGLFPDKNGVFAVPYRENLVTAKVTANLNRAQYLSVRRDAQRLGMPLVVWAYPRGSAIEAKGGKDSFYAVDYAARTASELGADVVKVNFPHPEKRSGVKALGSRHSFSCRCNSQGAIRITSFGLTGIPAIVSAPRAARAIR